ncbi:MAG: TetR family transcriptional regulator [Chloroflexota bacterium]
MLENDVKKLDPRAKRTLKVLRTAMMELLEEQEFSKITVQDITERAEVNRATFYDHFVDKYELMNDLVRQDFQSRVDSKLPDNPSFTLDNLRVLTLTVSDYLGGFVGHCVPTTRSDEQFIMMQQVQVTSYEIILKWLKSTPQPPTQHAANLDTVATVTSFAIFGLILRWTKTGRKTSPERLTDQVVMLLTSGIGDYLIERV